ncbi:Cyclic pyranopterin monophosphate synthase [Falsiruegeria litorea R37]|uniref:Cyclic pyranopterin monophosphate synthase n=1 Tax=Falsiruegeria litorea R37 TaxID=1200284 RepID=A0A1Y5RDF4_9RHOB|nr:Cyclic pyranopterin monophosphate synthase [Falsiruegeria litorea R37]
MKDIAQPPSLPQPAGRIFAGADRRAPLREGLIACGEYGPTQTAGRFYPVACVALEVTQRCNLDCTLCYLSDQAEVTFDPPLRVLFARLATIHSHYGPGVSVQLTGGDPTLRRMEDLEALCREIRRLGMRSCLMTNGIRATRDVLRRLAQAGLNDVAFHVDMTQERSGYPDEAALNAIRLDYIARAQGLGLRILFNTTVFGGNFTELPMLARFFRDQDHVAFVSFQMQADTGRGVLRARPDAITQSSVMQAIEAGYGCDMDFDAAQVGHSQCNRYASVLRRPGFAMSLLRDRPLVRYIMAVLEAQNRSSDGHLDIADSLQRLALRHPVLAVRAALGLTRAYLRAAFANEWRRPSRQTVFVHNFMAADELDADRCASCVFMVATAHGPLSMCVHNAQRDAHLASVDRVETDQGPRWWNGAVPSLSNTDDLPNVVAHPGALAFKRLKGRLRAQAQQARRSVERP